MGVTMTVLSSNFCCLISFVLHQHEQSYMKQSRLAHGGRPESRLPLPLERKDVITAPERCFEPQNSNRQSPMHYKVSAASRGLMTSACAVLPVEASTSFIQQQSDL